MFISVVISTYNGENFIVEQLDSIKNQSRCADEVIIYDDCSTDNTADLVSDYIKRNDLKNWIFEVNSENCGWRRNFNKLINLAKGDLVFTCDQDDIWDLNKLLIMEKVMEENDQILLLTSDYILFYGQNDVVINSSVNDYKLSKIKPYYDFFSTKFPGCTYCIRKKLIRDTQSYWNHDIPHDAFYYRMALYSDGLYSISVPLIKWRQHSNSTYSKEVNLLKTYKERMKWLEYAEKAIAIVYHYLSENSIYNKDNYIKYLKCNERCIMLRKKLFDTQNPIYLIKLLFYKKCYKEYKKILLDAYLVYIKKER